MKTACRWVTLALSLSPLACMNEGEPGSERAQAAIRPSVKGSPSAAWLADIRARLEASERAISPTAAGFEAASPSQRLKVAWDPRGVSFSPLTQRLGRDFEVTARLRAVARGSQAWSLSPGAAATELGDCQSDGSRGLEGECQRRLEINHGVLRETWENLGDRIQQAIHIDAPLPGSRSGPLDIEMDIDGAVVEIEGDGVAKLVARDGGATIRAELRAISAAGEPVPFTATGSISSLSFSFPDMSNIGDFLVIYSLGSAAWQMEGNDRRAYFGSEMTSAGDVNGDGYDDIIIGCRSCENGQADEGRAFVFHGSSTGLAKSVSWIGEINRAYTYFASEVDAAGDENGDGYDDVVVTSS
ncbi:MAG: FG-GAP repeat protein, partial [Deltaproteobacteria bacterium]|nr:FG-GAP repeat protein [Deltaproteobacteria bacterium]